MSSTNDFLFALRTMMKSPGLTAAGVIALALGIGANTAIFSLADALLFKPLTFPDDSGVYVGMETPPGRPDMPGSVAPANYMDWAAQNHSFEQLAAFEWWGMSLTQGGYPQEYTALRVSKEFFPLMRGKALLGRTFLPEEDAPGRDREVVLGNRMWRERFNSDPKVVGRTVQFDLKSYTIVGVMPRDFEFPTGIDMWAPLALDSRAKNVRDTRSLFTIGRLAPGVGPSQAQAELRMIAKRLERSYPDTNHGWGVKLMAAREYLLGQQTGQYLVMLLVAVGFVLLIACANVANVLFARSMARQKEIALRVALGAGRGRLVRQLLTESLVLSGVGMLVGIALGYWQLGLLVSHMPVSVARYVANWDRVTLDWRALLFTAAMATLAGVVSGILPALRASRPDLAATLKEGGRGSSQSQSQHRLKSALLVAEIALSLMLLVGAGLMVRGVGALYGNTDRYEPEKMLTFQVGLPDTRYQTSAQVGNFFRQAHTALDQIPGAQDVAFSSTIPYSAIGNSHAFVVEGQARERGAAENALVQTVSPEFVRLLHLPMRAGRFIADTDDQNAPKVAVVSESVARKYWPGQDPVGRHLKLGSANSEEPWLQVVGVISDIPYSLFARGVPLVIYRAFDQNPQPFTFVEVRASDPKRLATAVRRKIAKLDAELPLSQEQTYAEMIRDSLVGLSYVAVMMSVLGIMALALACVGVYGVMAFSVTERTREIGIRMALGARAANVVGMILRRGAVITGIGLLIGLVFSVAVARLLASLIWGVGALDLATFVGVSAALVGVALLASYLPARRASRVDPLISLRSE